MEATEVPEKVPKVRRPAVAAKSFIKAWQEAGSVREVCNKLGMKPASASQRATNLRKRGIMLKKMPRNDTLLDIASLQKLADKYDTTEAVA